MEEFQKMGVVAKKKIENEDVRKLISSAPVLTEINRVGKPTVKEMLSFLRAVLSADKYDFQIVNLEKFANYWKINVEQFLSQGFSGLISYYYKVGPDIYYFDLDYQNLTKGMEREDGLLIEAVEKVRPGYKLRYVFDKDEKERLEEQVGDILDSIEEVFDESYRLQKMHEIIYGYLISEMKTNLKEVLK